MAWLEVSGLNVEALGGPVASLKVVDSLGAEARLAEHCPLN